YRLAPRRRGNRRYAHRLLPAERSHASVAGPCRPSARPRHADRRRPPLRPRRRTVAPACRSADVRTSFDGRTHDVREPRAVLSTRTMARAGLALMVLVMSGTLGCEAFRSDSENFSRQREAERARAVSGMRAATQQTKRGADVSGEALGRLLSG